MKYQATFNQISYNTIFENGVASETMNKKFEDRKIFDSMDDAVTYFKEKYMVKGDEE